jgi:hypothetical protein
MSIDFIVVQVRIVRGFCHRIAACFQLWAISIVRSMSKSDFLGASTTAENEFVKMAPILHRHQSSTYSPFMLTHKQLFGELPTDRENTTAISILRLSRLSSKQQHWTGGIVYAMDRAGLVRIRRTLISHRTLTMINSNMACSTDSKFLWRDNCIWRRKSSQCGWQPHQ